MAYQVDIERLNYYEGEFLGAADFEAEQEYHRDMRRRHNLGQHTWGIVTGLELAQGPTGAMDGQTAVVDVYLQPGMAVDGFGREIVVLNQIQLTQEMFAAFYDPNPSANPKWMYVWIAYQQALLQPPSDACTSMNVSNAFGRIEETYVLSVTASTVSQPNNAIVVAGNQTIPPVEPTSPPSGTPTVTDPPPIDLPYDDSVPFQEFSTDDSNLFWWLALGRVMWDPHNEVFLQTTAAAAGVGRQYAGNVAAIVYAPAGMYTIVDRNAPNPKDPNYQGVQAEVVGSLQVDGLLNAETNALIGGPYDPTSTTPLSPLTIIANGTTEELIQFRNPSDQETWHICENLNGNPGINFGENTTPTTSPTIVEGRLFLQSGGNVGVGTVGPEQNLSVNAALNLDQAAKNNGKSLNPGLSFGSKSGEGIASNRKGTANVHGLDFYTGEAIRMSITHSGNVGIGTTKPGSDAGMIGGLTINGTGGTQLTVQESGVSGFALNVASGQWTMFDKAGGTWNASLSSDGGNIGIGTATPQQSLSVNGGLNIDQGQGNTGSGSSGGSGIRPGPGLTFGSSSGEGIASQRQAGPGDNLHGLDFYTAYHRRMSIANDGNIHMTGNLTIGASLTIREDLAVGAARVNQNVPAPGALTVNGNRTYLLGTDAANWHWIMAGGTSEFSITAGNNAIGLSYDNLTGEGFILVNPNWTVTFSGPKTGYVVDRFIHRARQKLERGDVVVIHKEAAGELYGGSNQIPLIEVERTTIAQHPSVCGIVDRPSVSSVVLQDLDPKQIDNLQIGLMVTLGSYAHCKVDADIAPITAGDLLTTSTTEGHAQKLDSQASVQPGVVIGKALASLEKGRGLIPVLVSQQ